MPDKSSESAINPAIVAATASVAAAASHDMFEVLKSRVITQNEKAAALPITTWITLFTTVAQLFLECMKQRNQTPAAIAANVRRPRIIHRIMFRNAMIKELGRTEFKKIGGDVLHEAFVAVGQGATEQEIEALLNEVKNG